MIRPSDVVTFVNWGNIKIIDVQKENDVVTSIKGQLNLNNTDFKKTMKVTWLAETKQDPHVEVEARYYNHIISKPVIDKDEDWMNCINSDSLVSVTIPRVLFHTFRWPKRSSPNQH